MKNSVLFYDANLRSNEDIRVSRIFHGMAHEDYITMECIGTLNRYDSTAQIHIMHF